MKNSAVEITQEYLDFNTKMWEGHQNENTNLTSGDSGNIKSSGCDRMLSIKYNSTAITEDTEGGFVSERTEQSEESEHESESEKSIEESEHFVDNSSTESEESDWLMHVRHWQ